MVAAGSKGIGRAIAEGLRAEGCEVAVCSRNEPDPPLEGVRSFCCDVSDPAQIRAWFEECGPPDILVTNTGGPPAGLWPELTDDQWQVGFDSTLMNVVRMVRLAAPSMRERGWGRIVHVTSLAAREPSPLLAISSTLRAGISSLTRLQALELAPHGVTVNAVLPGHTLTDRQVHLAEVRASRAGATPEEMLARQGAEVPVGRLATPEEIAAAAVFLCSRPASYITGVNLLVDGGLVKAPG